MRRKAFGANGALVVSVSRISPRTGRLTARSNPPLAFRKSRREVLMSRLRVRHAGSLLDRGADTRVGAAATDVARHRGVDVRIARLPVGGEQRARRHDLARLAVPALRHVERAPRRLDFLARGRGADGFDGGDALPDRRGYGRDARSLRLAVDVNRARAAKPRAAAELRAGHGEHVAQRPEQRGVFGDVEAAGPSVDVEGDHDILLRAPVRSGTPQSPESPGPAPRRSASARTPSRSCR